MTDAENTAGDVWADTAYRSALKEAWLAARGLLLRIHRKKPAGRPMAPRTRRANLCKSAARSAVEHVFARQTRPIGLMARLIGIARVKARVTISEASNGAQHRAPRLAQQRGLAGVAMRPAGPRARCAHVPVARLHATNRPAAPAKASDQFHEPMPRGLSRCGHWAAPWARVKARRLKETV